MNPIAIELGPISIYWYSIFILFAMFIGSFLFFRFAKKDGYKDEFLTNLLFYGIICGIVGARLYYVIFNLSYYVHNPLLIFAIWNGGLAIHGGILGGAIWFIYYSKKNNVNFLKIFDLIVPSLIIAQAIGRWGNFFNMEAHGPMVSKAFLESIHIPNFIINGMCIDGVYYHPTFFYESLWCFLGFVILLFVKKKCKVHTGTLTGIYFMWYSICRYFIEILRTDSLMIGQLKVAKIVSVLLFALGIFLIFYKKKVTRMSKLKERGENYEV